MSNVIKVTGSLSELLKKIDGIIEVVDSRIAEGFPIKQAGHEWEYKTTEKDNVCAWCSRHHGDIYDGADIDDEFPDNEVGYGMTWLYPRSHQLDEVIQEIPSIAEQGSPCNCTMDHVDPEGDYTRDLVEAIRSIA